MIFFNKYIYRSKANINTATIRINIDKTQYDKNQEFDFPITISAGNNKISAIDLRIKFNSDNKNIFQFLNYQVVSPENYFEKELLKKIYDNQKAKNLRLTLLTKKANNLLTNNIILNLKFKTVNYGFSSIGLTSDSLIVGPTNNYYYQVDNYPGVDIAVYPNKSCTSNADCGQNAVCSSERICVCQQGFFNNDGNWSNGCEDFPSSNPSTPPNTDVVNLNLSLRFQGIRQKPADQYNRMNVKVYALTLTNTKYCGLASVSSNNNGIWSGQVSWRQNEEGCQPIPSSPLSNIKFLVKGPKHLQKRVCDPQPTETYPGSYRCNTGRITLQPGNNNLNLSGIYLLVGDLPQQDGIVNAYDASLVRQCLGKNDQSCLSSADLNLDGIVNAQDYSLIIEALSVRTDEE